MQLATTTSADESKSALAARLLNDYLAFVRYFYKEYTGTEFVISRPIARKSHHILIADALMRVHRGEVKNLLINVPPRYSKTEMIRLFIAWCWARNPRCNWLYISADEDLATKSTAAIRAIMRTRDYQQLFGVTISRDADAKGAFETNYGGKILARGVLTQLEGHGGGIKYYDGFGGAIIEDDMHKAIEVYSDTIRNQVKEIHKGTIIHRRNNGARTPIIHICQRLHEDDTAENQIKGYDGLEWTPIVLQGLDSADNALDPRMHTAEELKKMAELDPETFWAKFQQKPQPAGGGIFKRDHFVLLLDEPEILVTFITADSAETDKTYNDATVFSFWGVYYLPNKHLALHWINCWEIWVEPFDLENNFMQFWQACSRHPEPPLTALIEKKSTGVTLSSVLSKARGLNVIPVERTSASGSKTARFLSVQPFVASGFVSLPKAGRHTEMCLDHMKGITKNGSHLRDDICDTYYDAANAVFITKLIKPQDKTYYDRIAATMAQQAKAQSYYHPNAWSR